MFLFFYFIYMKKSTLWLAVILWLGTVILAGCNCNKNNSEEENVGIANPASVYCEEQWGTLIPMEDEDGAQYAMCQLDAETICEEWAFYRGECPAGETGYPETYVKTSLTNEDIDHIEEIMPPLSFDFETWNMDDETMVESGHYDYPEDVENWYVFIPEHATMASREVKSSGIQDGMIYTDTDVTLQDDTVVSVLYIHDPETLFVRAITVENGNYTTYYRNFLYNADVE